jgi:cytochrome oxidase Cu insertion factor (SCO1/SenC/PrrC family)
VTRLTAVLLIALSAAGLLGAAWHAGIVEFVAEPRAELPRIGKPFALTAHTGERATSASFGDKAMLVAFGYTACPDICPTLLQTISDVMDRLPPATTARLQPLFITVDPERDGPEVLASYLGNFRPGILGLTGTPDEIAAVAKSFYVYSGKVASPDMPGSYMMEHASSLFLVSSDNRLLGSFGYGRTSPDEIARAIDGAVGLARR